MGAILYNKHMNSENIREICKGRQINECLILLWRDKNISLKKKISEIISAPCRHMDWSEDIRRELGMEDIVTRIETYHKQWLEHVDSRTTDAVKT